MAKDQQSDASSPAHYSTSNFAWNNVACGPGKSLLNDSEKVSYQDERQLKHASVNLDNSNHQGNHDQLKKEESFKLIIKARELVKTWKTPSLVTMQQYQPAVKRLRQSKKWPEDYAQTKDGFYYYRAALVANALSVLQKTLVIINQLQKKDDPAWISATTTLVGPLKILSRYPPDQEKTHLGLEIKSLWQGANKNPRSNAKRKGIGTLPPNWRADFWKNFPENSPHRLALAILSTTGCRPSELSKGVQVKLDEHGNLKVSIRGTKTHDCRYGQEYRELTIMVESKEALFLQNSVIANAEPLHVTIKNPKALSEAVRRNSKKLWPRRKYVVSPYSFRHQFAADLKNDLYPEEIAMAMGHSVCKTQQHYGTRNQGKSGVPLIMVTAEKNLFQEKDHSINCKIVRTELGG
ncbi:MAG: site-specific integrase [Deltaproteobacteria bacterium]|jgi:integrase|uniref:site-specific integrase n=1 Tax=Hydrosulfovibrio ferrireducens TaxID=2934181 RepID=UPI0012295E2E|nr:MAG: site-specific integrase [Deltaproteobacteria bacterium]